MKRTYTIRLTEDHNLRLQALCIVTDRDRSEVLAESLGAYFDLYPEAKKIYHALKKERNNDRRSKT